MKKNKRGYVKKNIRIYRNLTWACFNEYNHFCKICYDFDVGLIGKNGYKHTSNWYSSFLLITFPSEVWTYFVLESHRYFEELPSLNFKFLTLYIHSDIKNIMKGTFFSFSTKGGGEEFTWFGSFDDNPS